MGPRWLLLSSRPNEEFHAFLADLLDQQRPLCPTALLFGAPPSPSPSSRCTAETMRPGETDSLEVSIMMRLLTFFRPYRPRIMRNKEKCQNDQKWKSRSSHLIKSLPDMISTPENDKLKFE